MSIRPTHHGTAVVAALLLPAAAVLGLSGTAHAAGATPADLPQQQVAAIAEAAAVYISGSWSGYVAIPTDDGQQWSPLLEADFSCSGFVASSDGYVVTAGHCADVAQGKKALVDEFLSQLVQSGDITAADEQDLLAAGAEDALPVEGQQAGSPPVLTSKVYPAIAIGGTGNFQAYDATLVDDRPLAQGDVALLKVDPPSPLPVLAVASAQPQAGDTVDAIGYPGDVTDLVSDSVQPTFAKGQISGRQQTSGGPFTQVGVAMSAGMSGGPVVNGQGEVVGTVSFGPSDDTQQLNFASTEDNVQALLARNGVKNTLSPTDQQYRKGISEYFGGHFHAAAADLAAVVSSAPTQALAQQYKEKAIAGFPNERTPAPAPHVHHTSGLPVVAVLGAVGGLLVAAVAVLALVVGRRRRGSGGVRAVASAGPSPQPGPAFVPVQVPSPAPTAASDAASMMWSSPVAAGGVSGGAGTALLEAPVAGTDGHGPTRYCASCGTGHSPGSRFCAGCGAALA